MFDYALFAATLAISLFDTVTLLWLGLTVFLTGNRRRPATIAGSAGLLLGSLFFGGHTLIITHTLGSGSFGVNIVWRVMWVVAVAAPYFWGLSIFYYSGDQATGRWVRRVLTIAGFALIVVLLVLNPVPSFNDLIFAEALTPSIAWAYVPYLFLCFTLPLIALRSIPPSIGGTRGADPFRRARPWLIAAASMLALAVIAFAFTAYSIVPRAIPISNLTLDGYRAVYIADGVIAGFIGLAIIFLGRAVLSNNILTERPQSGQGFFARWRSVVIVSILGSLGVAFLYFAPIRPIYSLLLTAVLGMTAYALFNWRQYEEHEAFMKRLRPFVTSLHLHDHLISTREDEWHESRELFDALCRDALNARRACLLFSPPDVIGGSQRGVQRIEYHWSIDQDPLLAMPLNSIEWARLDADHWALPLADSRGAIGRLILGPKINGSEYTAQELQVAATCAERILDALAGEQLARMAVSLLRQRIAQVQVMSAQHKRLLHDEILPQIHLALLKIEALRNIEQDAGYQADKARVLPYINEASSSLTQSHRRLSALVRDMSAAAPTRLESEGLIAALKSALDHDFRDSFDRVDWQVADSANNRSKKLPLFVSEVIFYAAQEAMRNAARHARGSDAGRKLNLFVSIESDPDLKLVVADDGVGLTKHPERSDDSAGVSAQPKDAVNANESGSGLLFHRTMLTIIGGSLSIEDRSGGGTQVVIEAT
jgi:signal transduction histidine kinase